MVVSELPVFGKASASFWRISCAFARKLPSAAPPSLASLMTRMSARWSCPRVVSACLRRCPNPWVLLTPSNPRLYVPGPSGGGDDRACQFVRPANGSGLGDNLVSLQALLSLNDDKRHLLALLQ